MINYNLKILYSPRSENGNSEGYDATKNPTNSDHINKVSIEPVIIKSISPTNTLPKTGTLEKTCKEKDHITGSD